MELEARFTRDILANRYNAEILRRWDALALPDSWLVAGCLFQSVWNRMCGRAPEADIKDYDVFYFDASDSSEEGERIAQSHASELFGDLGVELEVSNQARVHRWYPEHFGRPYPELKSSRDGIDRFLVPSTCVAIKPGAIYAPYGLSMLYEGQLSMNPLVPHRELFDRKVASYVKRWPWLRTNS